MNTHTLEPTTPLITSMKSAQLFMRIIAFVVIFAHTVVIGAPTIDAVRGEINRESSNTQQDAETELSATFVTAIEKLALLKQLRKEGKDTDAVLGELSTLQGKIESLDKIVMQNFAKIGSDIKAKKLPAVILKRHSDMVANYTTKTAKFLALLKKETETGFVSSTIRVISNIFDGSEVTPSEAAGNAVSDGNETFSVNDFKRSNQEFDPNNLPTKALQPDKNNKPKTSKQEFIQAGLEDSPQIKLAALGDFKFDKLEEASNPLYLAESDEVQLTQEIKDKAAELDYDAVKIYHWVRNNVEWLPSWGAIQDAELTLEAKRGNAMDIASLTISLLRASGIPARYVHGTIDVPVEKYKNWVGGFTSYEAAGNYASSAGIPITSVISGGQVKTMRLEHVWVEAAIDFQPSRGAKNKDADTWVQLDPSFKQYEYQEGLDVVAISGLDMDKLAKDFVDSGTVNEQEGWATGFDPTILQNAQTQAQQKLEAHIATMNNPTVGDVIGGKKTIIKEYPTLPSSLPNHIQTVGTRYDKLPGALQQKIEFAFGKDILGDMIDPITFPFAKLNNEKVTLSFKPATQADEDALASLIPEGITDVSQLPTSIPSYLVSVIPELKVNGQTVKTGTAMRLGEEINFVTGIRFAGKGYRSAPRTSKVIAGSYLHVNVFAGSVSPVKLKKLQAKLESTKATLESSNQAQIAALTRDDILGDMFYAGGLGYYSQLLSMSYYAAIKDRAYFQLAVGYGTTGHEAEVNTFFGFPRSIKTGGIVYDIPMLIATASRNGNVEGTINYTIQVGMLGSALEHILPEQMYANPSNPSPDAISTVKAFQKASSSGQKIYHINQNNMSQILPLLHHNRSALNEIKVALNIGKEVTTHTDSVSIPGGWSGYGYTIIDPTTGDGAYKISGGRNGGILDDLSGAMTWAALVSGLLAAANVFAKIPGPIGTIANIITTIAFTLDMLTVAANCPMDTAQIMIILFTVITIFTLLFSLLALPGGGLVLAFAGNMITTALGPLVSMAKSYVVENTCQQ